MFKVIDVDNSDKPQLIQMKDMEPCSIGRIMDYSDGLDGVIVMRTAARDNFEVMRLSNPAMDRCWEEHPPITVELLKPGEQVILEVI